MQEYISITCEEYNILIGALEDIASGDETSSLQGAIHIAKLAIERSKELQNQEA